MIWFWFYRFERVRGSSQKAGRKRRNPGVRSKHSAMLSSNSQQAAGIYYFLMTFRRKWLRQIDVLRGESGRTGTGLEKSLVSTPGPRKACMQDSKRNQEEPSAFTVVFVRPGFRVTLGIKLNSSTSIKGCQHFLNPSACQSDPLAVSMVSKNKEPWGCVTAPPLQNVFQWPLG